MPAPPTPITVSLVHATYFAERTPREYLDMWLNTAERPDLVEYVVAMDESDIAAIQGSRGIRRVVSPDTTDRPSTVRNWNAAADLSRGDILFVIADDLSPQPVWDTHLRSVIGQLNPLTVSFGVKVSDSPKANDVLLRHPVISRAWFLTEGLFDPHFDGVYCDDDITYRLYSRAFILDGRALPIVDHRHPQVDRGIEKSLSHKRQNAPSAYSQGKGVIDMLWPARSRPGVIRMVPQGPSRMPIRSIRLLRPFIIALDHLLFAPRRWKHKYLLAQARRLTSLVRSRRS